MISDYPLVFAHRGLAEHAPENTKPAYIAALALGMGLEIDLRLSADGQIVIFHDRTVDRVTDGQGELAQLDFAAIRQLDAGQKFDRRFSGERVLTLAEVLKLVKAHSHISIPLMLDIKVEGNGIESKLHQWLVQFEMVQQSILIGQVIRSKSLRQVYKDLDPLFMTSVLANQPEDWAAALADDTADWIYARFLVTATQVEAARAAGKHVIVSGPLVMNNEPENWQEIRQAGALAVLTDYPIEFQRQYGRPWAPPPPVP